MTTHRYPRRMEIKRHRLLEAAQEIFLEKGFHAASMSDIAKKAEVSPPHIYNFYKNKADLAMAVQERMNQESIRLKTACSKNDRLIKISVWTIS